MSDRTDLALSVGIYSAGALVLSWLGYSTSYRWLVAFVALVWFHLLLVDMSRADDIEPGETWRDHLRDHGMAVTFTVGLWLGLAFLVHILR